MNLKKDYFKLNDKEFNNKLESLKNNSNTNLILNKYYFYIDEEIFNKLLIINNITCKYDLLFNTLTSFSKNQIIKNNIIEDIKSTNSIENLYTSRHTLTLMLDKLKNNDDKLNSIVNSYLLLLENKYSVKTLKDVRDIYDVLFKDNIKEKPDGKYFRKQEVFITDGLTNVHTGFYPEKIINDSMKEFINMYNSKYNVYLKSIISHLMIEKIHPFYDGNGRFGRYLFSNLLLNETNSSLAFNISKIINNNKNKYYSLLESVDKYYEFNFINNYIIEFLNLLIDGFNLELINLNEKIKLLYKPVKYSFTKAELKIYKTLKEATLFSHYGLTSGQLIKETSLSKRTIISTLNKFKELKILKDTKISKYNYHKIII